MPTYLYECPVHGEFEEYHSMSIKLEDCPKCIEDGKSPEKVKRLMIQGGSRGIVTLSGNEYAAHIKSEGNKLRETATKKESVMANLVGESKYQDNTVVRDYVKNEWNKKD